MAGNLKVGAVDDDDDESVGFVAVAVAVALVGATEVVGLGN